MCQYYQFIGAGVEDAQVEELFSLDDSLLDDLKLATIAFCLVFRMKFIDLKLLHLVKYFTVTNYMHMCVCVCLDQNVLKMYYTLRQKYVKGFDISIGQFMD